MFLRLLGQIGTSGLCKPIGAKGQVLVNNVHLLRSVDSGVSHTGIIIYVVGFNFKRSFDEYVTESGIFVIFTPVTVITAHLASTLSIVH